MGQSRIVSHIAVAAFGAALSVSATTPVIAADTAWTGPYVGLLAGIEFDHQ